MAYNIRVYALDDGEKVAQNDLNHFGLTSSLISTSGVVTGGTINLQSAKNEVIGFQIMIQNNSTETASALDVSFTSLTSSGGYTISNSAWTGASLTGGGTGCTGYWNYTGRRIELFTEHYIFCMPSDDGYNGWTRPTQSSYAMRSAASGDPDTKLPADYYNSKWLPWGLIPLEAPPTGHTTHVLPPGVQGGRPFSVSGSRVQGIWCDIYFPPSIPSGTYSGVIKISSTTVAVGTICSIPISVKVWNFALPHQNVFPFSVMGADGIVWPYANYPSYRALTTNPDFFEHQDRYAAMTKRHRIEWITDNYSTQASGLSAYCTTSIHNIYWRNHYTGHRWVASAGYEGPGMSSSQRILYCTPYLESRTKIASGAHFTSSSEAGYAAGAQTWWDYQESICASQFMTQDPYNPFSSASSTIVIFYHDDEPEEDTTAPWDAYNRIQNKARWIHKTQGSGSALTQQCDVSHMVLDPWISLTAKAYSLTGYLDNFAIHNSAWGLKGFRGHSGPSLSGSRKYKSFTSTATRKNMTVCWYNGDQTNDGNFSVGPPHVSTVLPRLNGWSMYLYNDCVDNWFYWAALYNDSSGGGWDNPDKDASHYKDLWQTDHFGYTRASTGSFSGHGTGTILLNGENRWPGTVNLQLPGPIATINLKNLRRGVQDYHYFWLASGYGINVIPSISGVLSGQLDDIDSHGRDYPSNAGWQQKKRWQERSFKYYNVIRSIGNQIEAVVGGSFYAPTLTSPTNGQTVQLQTTFSWESVPAASGYKLQVTTITDDFTGSLEVNVVTASTSYTKIFTQYSDMLQWRVASLSTGATSSWSNVYSFTTTAAPVVTTSAYYISTSGNDSNNGLSISTSWASFTKANQTLTAGQTVYVGGGSYNVATAGSIAPQSSGTGANAQITYKNIFTEEPVLSGDTSSLAATAAGGLICISGSGKSWIHIEGIEFKNPSSRWALLTGATSNTTANHLNHITISACEFTRTVSAGTMANYYSVESGNYSYSTIVDCIFDRMDVNGIPQDGTNVGDIIGFRGNYTNNVKLYNNIVLRNVFKNSGHSNVNIFGSEQTCTGHIFMSNTGYNSRHGLDFKNTRSLVAHNFLYRNYFGGWSNIQWSASALIIRQNICSMAGPAGNAENYGLKNYQVAGDNGAIGVYDSGTVNNDNRIYHNTFVDNATITGNAASAAVTIHSSYTTTTLINRNRWVNNIFHKAKAYAMYFNQDSQTDTMSGNLVSTSGSLSAGNNTATKTLRYISSGAGTFSVAEAISSKPGLWHSSNIQNDALLVDDSDSLTGDFNLDVNSPAVKAGVFPASAVAGSTNSTSLTVTDAGFFMDGWGITGADWIVVGSGSPVQISSVNYNTNVITLSESRSWAANDGVTLAGLSARDIGALPYFLSSSAATTTELVAPELLLPSDNELNVPLTATFSWISVAAASGYELYLGTISAEPTSSSTAIAAGSAVTSIASGSGSQLSASSTINFSITVPNSQNRYLLASCWHDSALGGFVGATAGSQAMTKIGEIGLSSSDKLGVFGLANPATGSLNIKVESSAGGGVGSGIGYLTGTSVALTGTSTSYITATFNIPEGGSQRMLFVWGWTWQGAQFSGGNYGGTALTLLGHQGMSGDSKMSAFYLLNPPTGSVKCTLTASSAKTDMVLQGIVLSGVATANPIYTAYTSTTSNGITGHISKAAASGHWALTNWYGLSHAASAILSSVERTRNVMRSAWGGPTNATWLILTDAATGSVVYPSVKNLSGAANYMIGSFVVSAATDNASAGSYNSHYGLAIALSGVLTTNPIHSTNSTTSIASTASLALSSSPDLISLVNYIGYSTTPTVVSPAVNAVSAQPTSRSMILMSNTGTFGTLQTNVNNGSSTTSAMFGVVIHRASYTGSTSGSTTGSLTGTTTGSTSGSTTSATGSTTSLHPAIWMTAAEINAMKNGSGSVWTAARDNLLVKANAALNLATQSVVYTDPLGAQGWYLHDYFVGKPYLPGSDGVISDTTDRSDYDAMVKMSNAVHDLAIAYHLYIDTNPTLAESYATKAFALMKAWMLDSATYMNPYCTVSQSEVEIGQQMPGVIYACDLLYNNPNWNAADKAGILNWLRELAYSNVYRATAPPPLYPQEGNWLISTAVQAAATGILCEDDTLKNWAWNMAYFIIDDQIVGTRNIPSGTITYTDGTNNGMGYVAGCMKYEMKRTKGVTYNCTGLFGIIRLAELALRQGIDLYNYVGVNGSTIKLALDFLTPYINDPNSWPWMQIIDAAGYKFDGYDADIGILELCLTRYPNEPLWETIVTRKVKNPDNTEYSYRYIGRPQYDVRSMGPVTLTHNWS